MKEKFVEAKFKQDSLERIGQVNGILKEYAAQGFDLTLRQLYYQFVARGMIENSQKSYKRMGDLVNNARLAGLVDWDMITDRGRHTVGNNHWSHPGEIVQAAAQQFRIDHWADQDNFVMVMVEKQALEGVLIPVCRELDILFAANKGYSSSSTLYALGRMLKNKCHLGMSVHVLYLGDHDPSGIDMTRDVEERLELFSQGQVNVQRLALNWDQVEMWQPPENPAKETDARYEGYVRQFGESSWELDAVEPRMLAQLVTDAVLRLRDDKRFLAQMRRERKMKGELQEFADRYGKN